MIFEESTKSCIDSTSFHEKFFFRKLIDGLGVSIEKKEAEVEYKEFLRKKIPTNSWNLCQFLHCVRI